MGDLPDDNKFVRYVPWTLVRKDDEDNVTGILPQAFALRSNEKGLSVSWLEHANEVPQYPYRNTIRNLANSLKIKKKDRIAVCSVGEVKETAANLGHPIRIVHCQSRNNPSHSEIRRLPRDELELLEIIASECVVSHHRCEDCS